MSLQKNIVFVTIYLHWFVSFCCLKSGTDAADPGWLSFHKSWAFLASRGKRQSYPTPSPCDCPVFVLWFKPPWSIGQLSLLFTYEFTVLKYIFLKMSAVFVVIDSYWGRRNFWSLRPVVYLGMEKCPSHIGWQMCWFRQGIQ